MEINIIFLDIDGVLCLDRKINRKCLENLKTIVDETSARIVLSSSWRFFPKSRAEVEAAFEEVGIDSLLGWTGTQGKSRVDEIYRWMQHFDNKTILEDIIIKKWIVIDDMDLLELDEKRMEDHFVLTRVTQGITEETVKQAIMLLS